MATPEPDRDIDTGSWETLEFPAGLGLASTAGSTPGDAQVQRRLGPYLLVRVLGAGVFGEVWLATRDGELAHTRLAVKLPRAGLVDVDAIRREATLWAKVGGHPNVMPIFEATVYDGQVVIVSEYAADGSLADWASAHGGKAPSPTDAARMALGILNGLSHLHKLGVVHRDVKPANVLLQNGVPRLADFGVSRVMHSPAGTGRPAGTPAYMAPEAFDGVRSPLTDVWSVGVVLYQLLTGALPFPEREWSSLLKSVSTRDPAPLPPVVPGGFAGVVRRCLAKDPAGRFQSASEMAGELERLTRPPEVPTHSVRLLAHLAVFAGSKRLTLFLNVTNPSETCDREITHVWLEAKRKVYVENPSRPLPKRLKPQESWETWIELGGLPPELLTQELGALARVRLSMGEVVHGVWNQSVPERGSIPGEPDVGGSPSDQSAPPGCAAVHKRPWWKLW